MSSAPDDFVVVEEELGTTVKVQPAAGSCVDVPVVISDFVAAAQLEPDFATASPHSPLTLPCGTDFSLQIVVQWHLQKMQGCHPDVVNATNGALLMDVLEVSSLLQMKRCFLAHVGLFASRVRSLQLSWPLSSVGEMHQVSKKIRAAFGMRGEWKPSAEEQTELEQFFFEQGEDVTHSMAGAGTEAVNEEITPQDPFTQAKWEDDSQLKACPDCHKPYAGVNSVLQYLSSEYASHCRRCGRSKCKRCVCYFLDKSVAPLSKPGGPVEGALRKVCKKCYYDVSKSAQTVWSIFALSGLDVVEVSLLRLVCSQWKAAAQLCLFDYRLTYLEPFTVQSKLHPMRKKVIASSGKWFRGHHQGLVALFFATDWSDEAQSRVAIQCLEDTLGPSRPRPLCKHWHLLCTRCCTKPATEFTFVQLLNGLVHAADHRWVHEVYQRICELLTTHIATTSASSEVISITLSMLLDLLILNPRAELQAMVLKLALTSMSVTATTFINVTSLLHRRGDPREADAALSQLSQCLLSSPHGKALEGISKFIECLESINTFFFKDEQVRSIFIDKLRECHLLEKQDGAVAFISPIPFLFDMTTTIKAVRVSGIHIMGSNTHPLKVPLIDTNNVEHIVLFKHDDVRKDFVVCNIISSLERLFMQDPTTSHLMPIPIVKYHVLPTSDSSGIIQWISDARTIESLINREDRQTQESAVRAHLNKKNITKEMRVNFLTSSRFYTFVSYLLAIGDRHRENVMVRDDGMIFHIDFGMILGEYTTMEGLQKLSSTMSSSSCSHIVRIDQDLQNCVKQFSFCSRDVSWEKRIDVYFEETSTLMLAVRHYAPSVMLLLQHLLVHGVVVDKDYDALVQFLSDQLFIGSTDAEARQRFIERIRGSAGNPVLQDLSHTGGRLLRQYREAIQTRITDFMETVLMRK